MAASICSEAGISVVVRLSAMPMPSWSSISLTASMASQRSAQNPTVCTVSPAMTRSFQATPSSVSRGPSWVAIAFQTLVACPSISSSTRQSRSCVPVLCMITSAQ